MYWADLQNKETAGNVRQIQVPIRALENQEQQMINDNNRQLQGQNSIPYRPFRNQRRPITIYENDIVCI